MNTPETLFPSPEYEKSDLELNLQYASQIKGLELHYDFITAEEEKNLLKNIDEQHWLEELSRRVQHYGYKYDYKHRSVKFSKGIQKSLNGNSDYHWLLS